MERPALDLPGPAPRLIVGLGNPGERYARTRHNAGFLVVERLLREAAGRWRPSPDAEGAAVRLFGRELLLLRPLSYMNRSGPVVAAALEAARLAPAEMLVVVDDLYLPGGRVRLRERGGTGGHKGLSSIREHIGTEVFPRLRLGVGPAPAGVDLAEFVLEPLAGEAWDRLEETADRGAEAVRVVCREGLAAAMNRFNPAPAEEEPRS